MNGKKMLKTLSVLCAVVLLAAAGMKMPISWGTEAAKRRYTPLRET